MDQALRTQPGKEWTRRRERPTLFQGGFRSSDHDCKQMRFRILCSCMVERQGTSAGNSCPVQRPLVRVTCRFAFLDQPPLGEDSCRTAPDVFESLQDKESRMHQEDKQLVDLQRVDWKHPSMTLLSSLPPSKNTKISTLFDKRTVS